MTKGEMVEVLKQGLQFVAEDDYDMAIENVQTFEEAGLLTGNQGLVVRINGSEFQITVVKSR